MKKYFLSLFLLFSFYLPCSASTSVSGVITEDTIWSKANSPYVLSGQVLVDVGVKLTIEPGVEVYFKDNSPFLIFGDIYSNGNQNNRVYFHGNPSIVFRPNMNIYNSIDSHFFFTDFENMEVINMFHSNSNFDNIKIINSNHGILSYDGSVTSLSNSVINSNGKSFYLLSGSFASVVDSDVYSSGISDRSSTIIVYTDGILDIKGTSISNGITNPVSLFSANVNFESVKLEGGLDYGMKIYNSKVNVSSSTISNFSDSGIILYGSNDVSITDSNIVSNYIGISEYEDGSSKDLKLYFNRIESNEIGVLASGSDSYPSIVDARNNWWGDASGPLVENVTSNPDFDDLVNLSGLGNPIIMYGQKVLFKPWLLSPFERPTECCSSVIFLPGLQASRLYKKGILEDQLWEPNILSSDIEYLYLNSDGTPKNTNIYTRDIIGRTNVGLIYWDSDIYEAFIESMNKMVEDGDIDSWRAFPYDWRLDYGDIVTNGIKLQNSIEYMIPEIEKMASSSKTGKITIVTHSNGGLLAKVLIDKLKSQGKEALIDKLVMVAPPQVGTPIAIGALLHGEEQEKPFIMSKQDMRGLGENMKSAYNLLPSQKYFEIISEPVAKFDQSVDSLGNLYTKYGSEIDTYQEMVDFLKARSDGRLDPVSSDTLSPNVLSPSLLNYTDNVHSQIDNWTPPSHIEFIQVAGWGVLTTSGLEYSKSKGCIPGGISCKYFLDHKTIKTIDGDRTVVSPSATFLAEDYGSTYYLNLRDFNIDNNSNAEHSNIMEVPSLQDLIKNIITNSNTNLPEYFSKEKPEVVPYKNLRISMHSPVAIDAYDNEGNHTGLIQDSDSGNYFVDEKIPNSVYEEIGEGKYIYLDGGEGVNIKLTGLDTGTFTLQVENQEDGQTVSEVSFVDIPTTSNTEGELLIEDGQDPKLSIDIEGDGKDDLVLGAGKELTPIEYLVFIRKTVESLDINKRLKDSIIKRVDKLIKVLQKNHDKQFIKKVKKFNEDLKRLTKIGDHKDREHHKRHKYKTSEDIKKIIDMVNILLDLLEQK